MLRGVERVVAESERDCVIHEGGVSESSWGSRSSASFESEIDDKRFCEKGERSESESERARVREECLWAWPCHPFQTTLFLSFDWSNIMWPMKFMHSNLEVPHCGVRWFVPPISLSQHDIER